MNSTKPYKSLVDKERSYGGGGFVVSRRVVQKTADGVNP